MNNFDKIRNMTLDEMAEYLTKFTATYCEYCTFKEYCEDNEDNISCREVLKQWLQQEVSEAKGVKHILKMRYLIEKVQNIHHSPQRNS